MQDQPASRCLGHRSFHVIMCCGCSATATSCTPWTDCWPIATAVCKVLWQPGWLAECAKALGEEGEQFFSYWSKFAFTTRNQSEAGK